MARKIEIQIVGDADSFHKALGKATSTSSKLGNVMGSALKVGAVAGAAGLAAVGFAAARGLSDLMESQKVSAQTGAVLKSTGAAAGVTAKQVGNLANKISAYSGIDDEAVQAGENMLLTFTNIRNEAGKGNDIFNQSTKILADMSTAMGTDMKSSSIQLGKALNDPVKGITALTRVGVTFNEGQKKQIASMVKAGNTAGAQKVILKELNKEFGGSAKAAGDTLPGQLKKLSNAFDNAASAVIARLLPPVTRLITWATPLIISGMAAVDKIFARLAPTIGRVADQVSGAASGAFPAIVRALRAIWHVVQADVVPIVVRLKGVFQQSVTAIAKVLQAHGPELQRIFSRLGAVVKAVGTVAIPILRIAFVVILPRAIGILISAIDKVTGVIEGIAGFVRRAGSKLHSWADTIGEVAGKIHDAFQPVISVLEAIIGKIQWLIDHVPDIPSFDLPGVDIPGLAVGGPAMAHHSYVVGERGPEILTMGSRGGYVHSNAASQAMAGGGSSDVHVTVLLDGSPIAARVRAEQDKTAHRVRGRRGWSS